MPVLSSALLSACLSSQAPEPAQARAAAYEEHGDVQREDSEVEVTRTADGYRASKSVRLSNGFGPAVTADVSFATFNGDAVSEGADIGGYRIRVDLAARAPTEQEARDALAAMTVTHEDRLAGTALHLATRVAQGPEDAAPGVDVCIAGVIGCEDSATDGAVQRSASISASLPQAAAYVLKQSTSNGNAIAQGLAGAEADLETSNGAAVLDGRWDSARLDTANGPIEAAGDFAEVQADTSNGFISVALDTLRSVDAALSSSNGPIEVTLRRRESAGFDLAAQTSNGFAQIRVAGTEPVGVQTKEEAHWRSPDFNSRPVQVSVSADTSNGDVGIHD